VKNMNRTAAVRVIYLTRKIVQRCGEKVNIEKVRGGQQPGVRSQEPGVRSQESGVSTVCWVLGTEYRVLRLDEFERLRLFDVGDPDR